MPTPLIAYHGKQELKDTTLLQVAADEAADRIIQGHFWDGHTGCTVGCLVRGSNHFAFESMYGIDVRVAIWADIIHEGLSEEDSKTWTRRFMEAVIPGTYLGKIHARLIIWFFMDGEYGIKANTKNEELRTMIDEIVAVYQAYVDGGELDGEKLKEIAYLAYRANRAYRAYLTYLADLAYRADLAYLADWHQIIADKLVSLLQSAPMAEAVS